METENKIVGWFLLALGIGLILWAVYLSYGIFSGQKPVPEVFKFSAESISSETPTEKIISGLPDQLNQTVQNLIGQQLKGFLPINPLPTLLNLFAWSIFAGIIIFAGGQIARLGIQLLR